MTFDLGVALLTTTISAVAKIAADLGLADPARELREQLVKNSENQRQVAFEKAYQAAVKTLGNLTYDQKRLFEHRPFLDAVLAGLLNPTGELDLRVAAEGWAGDLPFQGDALRSFFRLLNNALIRDSYWGELVERYQTLRSRAEMGGRVDERKILHEVNIDTGGGVYVRGDIEIKNGDFVVRDKIVNNYRNYLETLASTGEAESKVYFRALAAECAELPLGKIDEKFTGKDVISLADVYIDLDVFRVGLERKKELHLLRRELEKPKEGQDNQRMALIKAIGEKETRRIVLLGVAGAGKTTFTDYLTYVLANAYAEGLDRGDLPETLRGLVPVRLVLRKAAAYVPLEAEHGKAEMLWNALEEDMKGRMGPGYEVAWKWLQKKMRDGRSLVLLDGLDEVPEAGERRACLLQAVEDFLKGLPKTQRVVLTARPYAYADPGWQMKECEVFNLAPLSPEQVGRFVERWYLSVRGSVNLDEKEAGERAKQLAVAIEARSYLGDLASRPLLLTQMAMVHSTRKELPEDRADLYEKTVDLLLVRWQRSGVGAALMVGNQVVQVDLMFIRPALAELAYQTHVRQRGTKEVEGPGDIPFGDLLAVFVKQLPKVLPADLTAYLENRTGLLVEREPGLYCFAHRSFQEYLAACHLLDTSVELSTDLRKLVDEAAAWWREVILLAIGKVRQGSLVSALDLLRNALLADELEQCPQPGVGDWRAAVMGSLGLAELRVKERQAKQAELPRNLPRARKWLVGVMERSGLPARERVEAGNALAMLGDTRFDADCCYLPKDDMLGFVWIPGGSFQMGSDPKRDLESRKEEDPQHTVELPEFYIQRYPVTVAQFGAFVGQSGYTPQYPNCLKGIANHPVVNVTRDDALAYCKWLERWLREKGPEGLRSRLAGGGRIRLPSEAEWEKAARGVVDAQIYPWGHGFDPDKANTNESGIGMTSPVGSFPEDVSPYGVQDMSGNVLEWCTDWWSDTYYRVSPTHNPMGPAYGKYHTVRGGSWRFDHRYARCAYRYRYSHEYFIDTLGFRVLSPGAVFSFSALASLRFENGSG